MELALLIVDKGVELRGRDWNWAEGLKPWKVHVIGYAGHFWRVN